MKHVRTHYRDIIMVGPDRFEVRQGVECLVCGQVYPCEKAGQEAAEEDWQ